MSASFAMVMPLSTSASGMLCVTTVASGSSSRSSVSTASSQISREPDVDTITGSATTPTAPYFFKLSAITQISAADDTMPIFTASGRMSVNTQSSWLRRNSGVDSSMP